jgi:hypothetical protein
MVIGMDIFRRHFAGMEDSFAIIGGAACDLWFTHYGRRFRSTKDIDMVLVLEARHAGFLPHFWAFLRAGDYQIGQRADGRATFFRFQHPATAGYPKMIEVFSTAPQDLEVPPDQNIVPIRAGEGVSSLSAILLDPTYYAFVLGQREVVEGLPLIRPSGLIPLKARAWLDLTRRRAAGDATVNAHDIDKHRSDVFRLAALLPAGESLRVPPAIAEDLRFFLRAFPVASAAWPAILASLAATGIRMDAAALIESLVSFFQVTL